MDIFKGNQFTCLRGIGLWGILGLFLFLILLIGNKAPIELYVYFICFGIFWFLFNSYMMYYFVIEKNSLIIRNHNFIWINKLYQNSEISEIVFETKGRMPFCLRMIKKNKKSRLFPACTLRNKNWFALKNALEKQGIIVRNECVD